MASRFEGPGHEALLNLLLASAHLRERLERIFSGYEITPGQYNVLRILAGAHPSGYPRGEISRRLIERAPDVTRLIDRLEERGLVERARSPEDGRLSITRLTADGLALLEKMNPLVSSVHDDVEARLGVLDAEVLSRICERLYGGEERTG